MSYYSRGSGPSPVGAAIVVFVALLIAGCVYLNWQQSKACESRGGVYFCPYKSTCVCLAKGVVLP